MPGSFVTKAMLTSWNVSSDDQAARIVANCDSNENPLYNVKVDHFRISKTKTCIKVGGRSVLMVTLHSSSMVAKMTFLRSRQLEQKLLKKSFYYNGSNYNLPSS